MARYYGNIGYSQTIETSPGVWSDDQIIVRSYKGDIINNSRQTNNGNKINDDINLSMTISIVADRFAFDNFHNIKYATYYGEKWKVLDVKIQSPRLVLTLGGVYND